MPFISQYLSCYLSLPFLIILQSVPLPPIPLFYTSFMRLNREATPPPQHPTLSRRASSPAQVNPQTLQQYLQQTTNSIARSSSHRVSSSSTPPRPNFAIIAPSSSPLVAPQTRLPYSLATLPEKLVLAILRFLPADDLVRICQVCKYVIFLFYYFYYLFIIIYYLLFIIYYYLLFVIYYLLFIIYYLLLLD
jgi:hypothetical protein